MAACGRKQHAFILTILLHYDIVFMEQKKEKEHHLSTVCSFSHTPACLPYSGSCPTREALAPPTFTMIRENSLFCKLIRIKSSSKDLFDSFMAGFRPEFQACPCCGAAGSCSIHAYYDRSLVDFIGGRPVRHSLCILRLVCSCGHTHAILPDFIIPYSSYGLFFILRVLAEYFWHSSSVEKLCERFLISTKLLYHWLSLFRQQKEEWLGLLSSMETSGLSFLKGLFLMPCYSDFASGFVRRFAVSFLQSHRNPASYCQQVFGP